MAEVVQSGQTVVEVLRARGLTPAMEQAVESTSKVPSDAGAWQVLGLLQLALNIPGPAEISFAKALAASGNQASTLGLETAFAPGNPLFEELRKQKSSIVVFGGLPASRNNLGVALMLQGKFQAALEQLDQAAVLEPDWPAPWLNGAIANLELELMDQAEKSIRMAMALGDKSSRAYTVLGEIELRAGRPDRAKEALSSALDQDPSFPFAQLLQAKVMYRSDRAREGERALIQALAGGPAVVADSRLSERSGAVSAIGGAAAESHFRLFQLGVHGGREGYRFLLQDDRMRVENRADAFQRLSFGEFAYSGSLGALYLIHRDAEGGRPGREDSFVGNEPTPDSRFGLRQSQAIYLKSIRLGRDTELLLNGAFRKAKVSSRADETSPMVTRIDDEQVQGEFRLDHRHSKGTTTLGAAFGSLDRRGAGGSPVDPAEQTMPIGKSTLWSAYLIHRLPLWKRFELTFGTMSGGAEGNNQSHFVLDLGYRTSGGRLIKLRATPRFNDSLSNLIPLDLVSDPPQDNPLDRDQLTTSLFNRSPAIQGLRTKMADFELVLANLGSETKRFETVIFNRRLNQANILAADTRVSSAVFVTPITEGSATGIEGRARFALDSHWTLRLIGKYQSTEAEFKNPTYLASPFPTLVPTSPNRIPNFPKLQGSARLDFTSGEWTSGLEVNFVGERLAAFPGTANGSPASFVFDAPAATTANLYVGRQIGGGASLSLAIFNIGSVGFFPGYPSRTTAVLSYQSRF